MKRQQELNNKARKKQKQQERLLLPRTLIVPDELTARKQQIEIFTEAIENASEKSGNVRVFQMVKRYERRRAASLNPKRLPVSFRQRAIIQMQKDPQSKVTRRVKRRRDSSRTHKDWLETHRWHAKRMVMVDWGKRIALKPNQKSTRSTYRALRDQAIFRDVSFQQIVSLSGDRKVLDRVLMNLCDPTEAKICAPRFKNTYGTIWIHEYKQYPLKAISKVGFLWNEDGKVLWIWVPCYAYDMVFGQVYTALHQEQQQSLPAEPMKVEDIQIGACKLSTLQNEYTRFEMRGRTAHTVLQHVFVPEKTYGYHTWEKLGCLTDARQVPPGTVVSLEIQDPRIQYELLTRFPMYVPKKTDMVYDQVGAEQVMVECESNQASKIWDREYCSRLTNDRPTNSDIQNRKTGLLGKKLEIIESDVRLPILLVQRGLEDPGWDVIAPSGWGLPLLHLFQYAGCQAGSMQSLEVDMFENGKATDFFDFPETPMYETKSSTEATKREYKFKTTPKRYRKTYAWNSYKLDLECLVGEDVIVWHTPRTIDIIQSVLAKKFPSFETFCSEFLQRIVTLCKGRPSFPNLNSEIVSKSCVRVRLELKEGNVGWNAIIHPYKPEFMLVDSAMDKDDIIGYVLRGQFSLNNGNPRAIGVVSLKALFQAGERLCIRNLTGRKSYEVTYTLIP